MIQDIYPSVYENMFFNWDASPGDVVISFDEEGRILVEEDENGEMVLPVCKLDNTDCIYLFKIDETRYFMENDVIAGLNQYYKTIREVRDMCSGITVFAAFTAYHLWKWYSDNKFCGKCGEKLEYANSERALKCPVCGNRIYPRINPAVIVGVRNGNKLLITRYQRGYANNALIAGFVEIGETLEETVAREVMEEAGVKVKNITYYKSQPWGMAQDVLVGFYCDVDGDTEIHMDEGELKYAEWVEREDIVLQPNNLSLTNEMMSMFKDGKA